MATKPPSIMLLHTYDNGPFALKLMRAFLSTIEELYRDEPMVYDDAWW